MIRTTLLGRLLKIQEAESTVVTLTLDVADSGILPPATRIFLKDSLASLPDGFKATADRVRTFVDSELRPETQGLFLVASPEAWEPVELPVPLENTLQADFEPRLAPLLAALERIPRAYVLASSEREAVVHQIEGGAWIERGRWNAFAPDRDPERLRSSFGRSPNPATRAGIGGDKRDRFEQTLEAETSRMLDAAVRSMAADHAQAPAAAVLVFGESERLELPESLRERALYLGAVPREESGLRRAVATALDQALHERREAEIRSFHERRAQGHLVALGPADVLAHRATGRLARIYLDPDSPVPGFVCRSCGELATGEDPLCGYCGGLTRTVSLAQRIVAHALTHPPLPITFVPRRAAWLEELGGMAGLLSQKGIHGKR